MRTFLSDVRQTLAPDRVSADGPLPPLLVALTLVTGLVDAFSYLELGHVFVANMTGNVVFLAFSLGGALGFSIPASLTALGAFSLGALGAGRVATRSGPNRARMLSHAAALQTLFLLVAVALAASSTDPMAPGSRYGLIVVLAGAMGVQNATARRLAVADLTTTVLTMTLTGLSADSSIGGGRGSQAGRRVVSIGAMLVGALFGVLLVRHVDIAYPLGVAAVVVAGVAASSSVLGRSNPPWTVFRDGKLSPRPDPEARGDGPQTLSS
ncbi:MAG TPA: YoaK family protein [Acidimicrobiales bacterium]|nr:YoaK family protein [Acidimicrobiales bacterium]